MKKWFLVAGTGLFLLACGGGAASSGTSSGPSGGSGSHPGQAGSPADGSRAATGAPGAPAPAPAQQDITGPANLQAPQVNEGPRVIRTGKVTIEVSNGSFNDKLDELSAVIAADKGYVSGTDTQQPESGGLRVATITYQIPSASFDDALGRIRRIGTLQNMTLSGQDVSSQYVDLKARLKVQEEQRDFYLALLAQAKTTQDLISIRNQLAPILDQIERLQGQIDYYDHATTYATLSVTMHEAAAGAQPVTDSWGLRTAVFEGARLFVGTINLVVLGLGAAGPFLLIGVPLVVLWRRRQRREAEAR